MKVKYSNKWYEVAMVQENFGQKWYEIYDEPDTNPEHTDWITHPDEVIEDEYYDMDNAELSLEFVKKYQRCRKKGVPEDCAILATLHDLANIVKEKTIYKAVKYLESVPHSKPMFWSIDDFKKAMEE